MRTTLTTTLLALSTTFALAQGGPLDPPPGAPSSNVYKTLDEVEARTPITSLPFTIATAGSYYLAKDGLTVITNNTGILISASNVTLDLNGFTITGGGACLHGISVSGAQTNIVIRNGAVRNWNNSGIDAFSASDSRFEKLTLTDNTNDGIETGDRCIVTGCIANDNGRNGLALGNHNLVSGCLADNSGDIGIKTGSVSRIEKCRSGFSVGAGFSIGSASEAIDCHSHDSDSDGFVASNFSAFRRCHSRNHGVAAVNTAADGFEGGLSTTVIDCKIGNIKGVGIRCTQIGGHIDGNYLADTQSGGINLSGASNVVTRNVFYNNVASPVINQSGGNIAPTGNASSTTNPWSNLQM